MVNKPVPRGFPHRYIGTYLIKVASSSSLLVLRSSEKSIIIKIGRGFLSFPKCRSSPLAARFGFCTSHGRYGPLHKKTYRFLHAGIVPVCRNPMGLLWEDPQRAVRAYKTLNASATFTTTYEKIDQGRQAGGHVPWR